MISQELTDAKLKLYLELVKVISVQSRDCDVDLAYQLSKDPDIQKHLESARALGKKAQS